MDNAEPKEAASSSSGSASTGAAVGTAEHRNANSGRELRRPWLVLVVDVGVPLGLYYLLAHFGVTVTLALALSAAVPALRVIWIALRQGPPDQVAMAMLLITVLGIPIALISGSPRVLLAKESLGTGPIGIWLLITAWRDRPVMSTPYRAVLVRDVASARAWENRERTDLSFRRILRWVTAAWGLWALIAFFVHIGLAFLLPIDRAVWAVNLVIPAMIAGSSIVTAPLSARLQAIVRADVDQSKAAASA